jgi:hypothetical protein
MGANLDDLTPATLKYLEGVANNAGVDLGINSTMNGTHRDSGHYAGTAVDIGYLNGKDIGHGSRTNVGMEALSRRVQQEAAEMGGLKWTGNLGPAGKFNGLTGPLQINDPSIRASHKNHVHLSRSKT